LKSIFFWDMTPCSALSGTRRFGGTYRLHLQGCRIVSEAKRTTAVETSNPTFDYNCVGFEILTAVVIESTIFWDITPCSPLKVNRVANCFHAVSLLRLFFSPKDGGGVFLRNVSWISTDDTALYPKRQYSSIIVGAVLLGNYECFWGICFLHLQVWNDYQTTRCRMWGFHSGGLEEYHLLGCAAV
jgi:hypothetical protein